MECSTPGFPVLHYLAEWESCSDSRPWIRWCHPPLSSSVIPFSSCPQSFPASGSFPISQLFAWWPEYWSFSFTISAWCLSASCTAVCIHQPLAPKPRPPLVTQVVKNPPAVHEIGVQSLGWEHPLEKGKATHSGSLAWRIPWMEKPGRLQSMGLHRVGHDCIFFQLLIYLPLPG